MWSKRRAVGRFAENPADWTDEGLRLLSTAAQTLLDMGVAPATVYDAVEIALNSETSRRPK